METPVLDHEPAAVSPAEEPLPDLDTYEIGGKTIADRLPGLREDADEEITKFRDRIAELQQEIAAHEAQIAAGFPDRVAKLRLGYEAHARLTRAGLRPDPWPESLDLNCKATDLPAVARAVGRIKLAYKTVAKANVAPDEPDMIRVTLKAENFPLRVHYVTPFTPGRGKTDCKIVRTTRVEAQLVCSLKKKT